MDDLRYLDLKINITFWISFFNTLVLFVLVVSNFGG